MIWVLPMAHAGPSVATDVSIAASTTGARVDDASQHGLGGAVAVRYGRFGIQGTGRALALLGRPDATPFVQAEHRLWQAGLQMVVTPLVGELGWTSNRQDVQLAWDLGAGADLVGLEQQGFVFDPDGLASTRRAVAPAASWSTGLRATLSQGLTIGAGLNAAHRMSRMPTYDSSVNPRQRVWSRFDAMLTVGWSFGG